MMEDVKKRKFNSSSAGKMPSKALKATAVSKASDLPIAALRSQLIESIKKFPTTIVVGETGSGKSTQLVQYLADELHSKGQAGCIVCTQPRRVAAVTIAQRVASERNCPLGAEVGYSIRFEDKTSHKTKIKFVTDGVLLRECMSNPNLHGYSVIILDEAHERSLQTDILMGLLRQLQDSKPSFKLVIMSATLQIDLFSQYFKDPTVVQIPGRQFSVDVLYTQQPEPDYVDAALLTCLQLHVEEEPGGVLVFLPGQDDIEALESLLEENLPDIVGQQSQEFLGSHDEKSSGEVTDKKADPVVRKGILKDFEIRPLYAAMPPEEQLRAFAPSAPGVRKFVLSTNIAETSVTISGIKYVIDSGFVKTRLIQPATGIEMLKVLPVSKAQANQRAGRAGRESEGKSFRLFCERSYEALEAVSVPEIQRVSVAQVVLQLKVLGVKSPMDFPYISPPSIAALKKALEMLYLLGALNPDQSLSAHGSKMASLPLDPIFAHLLLRSHELGCVVEVMTAVSLLSSDTVFLQPYKEEEKKKAGQAHRRFASREGDLLTLINIYEAWTKANKDPTWSSQNYLSQRALTHATSVRSQLGALLQKAGVNTSLSCAPEKDPFLKCLTAGLYLNVAKRSSSHDSMGNNHTTSSSSSHSNGASKHPVESRRLGKIFLDPNAAPYSTIRGNQPVHIHPSSVLFSNPSGRKLPEYVVFAELLITTKHYMRNVTAVEGSWLMELAPNLFKRAIEAK